MKIKTLNLCMKWNSCWTRVKLSKFVLQRLGVTKPQPLSQQQQSDCVSTTQFTGHNI